MLSYVKGVFLKGMLVTLLGVENMTCCPHDHPFYGCLDLLGSFTIEKFFASFQTHTGADCLIRVIFFSGETTKAEPTFDGPSVVTLPSDGGASWASNRIPPSLSLGGTNSSPTKSPFKQEDVKVSS